MDDETAFLRAILAAPGDPLPRLVYADWLEEQGDADSARRAEYLRAECRLDGLPADDPARRRLQDRLGELRRLVGDDWWRQLDWAKVEYCVEFEYSCPQRWDTLSPTDDPAVRHCPECRRNVYYCRSGRDALRHADAGECVAIDSRQTRISLRLVRGLEPGWRLGRVAPRSLARIPLTERGRVAAGG